MRVIRAFNDFKNLRGTIGNYAVYQKASIRRQIRGKSGAERVEQNPHISFSKSGELEVTKMAAFGVDIEPIRKGGQQRGLVTGFRVSWWRKDEAELKEAYRELNQPKVGRMARLRHEVDQIEFNATAPSPSLKEKIDATVAAMRAGGAPEEDIDAFVKSQAA